MSEVHGVNVFTVREGAEQALFDAIARIDDLGAIPGLQHLRLLRETGGSRFVNHMCWESQADFRRAEGDPLVAAVVAQIGRLVTFGQAGLYEVIYARG